MRTSCYDKAVELLGRRAHFRRELEQKLTQRGYPTAEVGETLDRLTDQGYLDDGQTANDFVALRARRGPEGRRRLAAELSRHGASGETIASALSDLPQDDLALARTAAEGWRARGGRDPAALARFLARKGFSERSVYTLLEELGEDPTAE